MSRAHVAGSAGGVATAVLSPPGPVRATAVAFLGYAAWLDPFELQRFAMLAARLSTRFVVVESPGFGTAGTHLTGRERWALLGGDFGPLATRLLTAAERVTGSRAQVVWGYSMGASTAAAAARVSAAHGAGPNQLVLVEPVGATVWRARELMAAMRSEDAVIDTFLAETAGVHDAVAPSDRTPGAPRPHRRLADMLLTANALRSGGLAADVASWAEETSTLTVVHGTDSFLCEPRGCRALVQDVRSAGGVGLDVPVPGSHGLWQSLPRVQSLVAALPAVTRRAA